MKKRILFINLRSYKIERMEPILSAKRLNLEIVLMCDSIPDIDTSYFEEIIVLNTFQIDKCIDVVKNYNKTKKIDGVLTWSDKDVQLVAKIGESLNIPTLPVDTSLYVRNKYEMRKKVSNSYPELCPRFCSVESFEQLEEAYLKIGVPAIFKPVGASGSKAIFKVDNNTNLKKMYDAMVATTDQKKDKIYSYFPNQYIYEEFLLGEEISIEGIVENNKVIMAGVTDKKITEDYSLEYQEIFPSKYFSEYFAVFRDSIEKIVSSLGINHSAFHAECKFDVSKQQLKLIEIAGRPGGGFITSHLVPIASGISFHEQLIRIAIGRKVEEKLDITQWYPKKLGFSGHIDIFTETVGTLKLLEGLDKVFEDPRVILTIPTVKTGHKIVQPPESFSAQYVATAVVSANTYEEVERAIERVQETIEIIVEDD